MTLLHVPTLTDIVTEKNKITTPWKQLLTNAADLINRGYPPAKNNPGGVAIPQSVTIPLVKLTGGGANGSLTFTNGILTSAVAPT